MIDEIMEYNRKFVDNKGYEPYLTSKYPDKKLAILTCMDTRLLELLPAALGIKNGDAKIIKNAGGVIVHPYGSVVRSLLVGILELGVGMAYPSVIRMPFERTVLYNQKSSMIRIHSKLAQVPEEIQNRSICYDENPVKFLNTL